MVEHIYRATQRIVKLATPPICSNAVHCGNAAHCDARNEPRPQSSQQVHTNIKTAMEGKLQVSREMCKDMCYK